MATPVSDATTDVAAPIQRPKEAYHQQTTQRMEQHLPTPAWTTRQKLALTCRILAGEGHESALAGQITARGPRPGTYHMLTFGLGFDEASASNIILVDDDLNVLEGEGMPNPSNRFHLWIYRHRPNVQCIVHTHPPYVSALSTVGEPLAVAHMDHAMFHDDCAYLPEWPGVPIGDEEGEIISNAIGDKRAILLAHHGQLVACGSVEEAAVMSVFMERAARLQVLARSIGPMKAIRPELAREAHDYRLKPKAVGATFHYFARRMLRGAPETLD
jgi:L-fuculose-phosphate aldolase